MIKRLVIGLVFVSMALHCAHRLGILSYVYQQRHQLAFALGLLDEVPIAECSRDYDFNKGLTIQEHNHHPESTVPPLTSVAHEINLFFTRIEPVVINPLHVATRVMTPADVVERRYASPALSIFHPPS